MRSILTRRNTAVAAIALAVGLVTGNAGGLFAAGSGTPANKAAASGSKLAIFNDKEDFPLLTSTIHTDNVVDLILQVTAECAIETEHTRNGKTTHNEANGTVQLWVEFDGQIVPIDGVSSPPQNTPQVGDDTDKVTFCQRHEQYKKTDGNTLCTEDPAPTVTVPSVPPSPSIDQCETETWFQRVKTANAFNWVRLNAGRGTHTIVVKGRLRGTTTTGTAGETSLAKAIVGNRTLVIEPTHMANDANLQTGTN